MKDTHYNQFMTIMPIPLIIEFNNSRGLHLFLSLLNLAIQERCAHPSHNWIWRECFFVFKATHRHHLTNLCFLQQGWSDILYIFPNRLKNTSFSLSMRKGILVPLHSMWQSNSSWLFCIFQYFAKNCQRLNFPYQPFSKIPILPIIATSSISPISLSQKFPSSKTFSTVP